MLGCAAIMRGYVHPDFERVRDALTLCLPRHGAGGAAVAVYHRGEKVVDLAAGTADAHGRPFTEDTLALSMSTTKGITATALHALIATGEVELDACVADYWPEFAAVGKGQITIGQALAHRAGLHEVAPLVERFEDFYDWDRMVRALERATPSYEPGTNFGYHAFTYGWLIGEVIRRVRGKRTFAEALHDVLAKPLGVDGLFVGVPEHAMHRVADYVGITSMPELSPRVSRALRAALTLGTRVTRMNTAVDESSRSLFPPGMESVSLNDTALRRASMPAVNGHFDARSLARVYAALAGDGSIDGTRLVARDDIDRMRDEHNGFLAMCRVIPFPLRIGLGYHRIITLGLRAQLPSLAIELGVASPRAFGHFGIGGSGGWADPERALSVGLVTNTFFGKLPMDLRTVAIATAAARSVDARDQRKPLLALTSRAS